MNWKAGLEPKTETQELHENWKEVRRVVKKGGGWADWMA